MNQKKDGQATAITMDQHILIVDDDPDILALLEAHLVSAGYTLVSATSGDDALQVLRERRISMMIVDWHMPGMSGEDLCQSIRTEFADQFTYIIVLTAETEKEHLLRAFRSGADDYMVKPFDSEQLLARVRVGQRIAQLQLRQMETCRLESERNRLREAVAAMEQVLGVIAHEIRTPLASVRAMSEFLLTPEARDLQEWDFFLGSLHNETVRMADMVNNLLEAARLNSGRANWNWSRFQLEGVCNDAIEPLRSLVDLSRVILQCTVEPAHLQMDGDSDAVRRLVLNLANNAIRHTSSGTVDVSVKAEKRQAADWIVICVRDSGCGIAPELMPRLGQAFALNAGVIGAGQISGSGLGLAICKGIVAAHGGTMSITSAIGKGTAVTVRLRADLAIPAPLPTHTQPCAEPCTRCA